MGESLEEMKKITFNIKHGLNLALFPKVLIILFQPGRRVKMIWELFYTGGGKMLAQVDQRELVGVPSLETLQVMLNKALSKLF